MTQAAYVGMLVRTAGGLMPIVRQYRPAVETYTWEFPAGTLDPAETPEQAARREVVEETKVLEPKRNSFHWEISFPIPAAFRCLAMHST